MGARFDIRSYSTAEIVLLGIFALGLLWASAVVSYRNKIRLSEPIELKLGGVSVSLPVEGGWQGSQTWAYNRQEDMFALTGRLLVGGKVGAVVQWRFMVVSGSVMTPFWLSTIFKRATSAFSESFPSGEIVIT